jgi:hypothetical protein
LIEEDAGAFFALREDKRGAVRGEARVPIEKRPLLDAESARETRDIRLREEDVAGPPAALSAPRAGESIGIHHSFPFFFHS